MELGKKIAEIRKENGLTQEDLAELCSVTRQTISNWENGKSYPDLETLVLISDRFEVSLDAMLKGDSRMVSEISQEQKRGKHFALKIAAAIAVTAAVLLGAYAFAYLHESYIPFDESGISATDSGTVYTDRNYSCFYGHSYVSETDGDEQHLVEFIYLTGSIYSQYLEKKPEKLLTIASYSEAQGQSVGEDGRILNYIVTEVYYLPESCVKELGLQKGKHAALIPAGTSESEAREQLSQIKEDSILLWKRP